MFKYFLIILTFTLSACTRQIETIVDNGPALSEKQAQVVSMNTSILLANMDILEEYFTGGIMVSNPKYIFGYTLLSQAESQCVGNDFKEFRVCLIKRLTEMRDEFDSVTGQGGDIDTYIDTIGREIVYMNDYETLDEQPMPSEYYNGSLWDENQLVKSCYNVLTGSTSYSGGYYYPDELITIPIVLGFQNTAYTKLVSIFPSWSSAQEIPLTREAYHCGWATFGPGYGTIFYVFEENNTVYLFIKDADGGGSGDFNYSIFAYRKDSQKFIHLGSFYAYSGIIPLPIIRNDDNGDSISSERRTILGDYKNRTFLYQPYIYQPMYHITHTIQTLLEQSIQ